MNQKQKDALIAMGLKIAGLEEIVRRHKICIDAHNTRLSDHDESIEFLDETAVQLSTCKCQAVELLKRIEKLDLEIVRADAFRQNHIERIVKLEKVNAGRQGEIKPLVFLKGTMSGSGGGVQAKKPGRPRKGVK